MSDTTQCLCTNHIVRFRSFLCIFCMVSFRRRVRIAGGRFWCAACNSVNQTCNTSTLFVMSYYMAINTALEYCVLLFSALSNVPNNPGTRCSLCTWFPWKTLAVSPGCSPRNRGRSHGNLDPASVSDVVQLTPTVTTCCRSLFCVTGRNNNDDDDNNNKKKKKKKKKNKKTRKKTRTRTRKTRTKKRGYCIKHDL